MRIENEKLEFHPSAHPQAIKLSEVQQQYMTGLLSGETIHELIVRYLKQGWLVDFIELFNLVEFLALQGWIFNKSVKDYFLLLKGQVDTKFAPFAFDVNSQLTKNGQYTIDGFRKLPFFRSLPIEFCEVLLKNSKIYNVPAQAHVCRVNEVSRDLYVMLDGQAAIFKKTELGSRFVAFIHPGTVFGETAFFLGTPRSADIVTQKSSQVLRVPFMKDFMDKSLNKDKAAQVIQRFWIQHALQNSDFFKNFPSDSLDDLTFSGNFKKIDAEQFLFKEKEEGRSAFIVIQGQVIIEKGGQQLRRLSQGGIFGEISLFSSKGLRTANALASAGTLLLEISQEYFYLLCSRNLFLAKEMQLLGQERIRYDIELLTQKAKKS